VKRVLRPDMSVLPESALVPDKNLLLPPPTQFTHVVWVEQPYFYSDAAKAAKPDGKFMAGTNVLLLKHDGNSMCRVVDAQGLHVFTAFAGLQPI
jgi:hypothetical protein